MSVFCIKCAKEDCVSLDLDDCNTFRCRECDETFDVADLESHVKTVGKMIAVAKAAKKEMEKT